MEPDDSGYRRLEDQISWYDRKSGEAQKLYKWTKYFTIGASALIPILALFSWTGVVAALGALIAVFEGINQVNQWQHNWITYRATCEALRHEKYTFMERADPYDLGEREAKKLLVERVESLISTEHSKWIAIQDEAAKNDGRESNRGSRAPD